MGLSIAASTFLAIIVLMGVTSLADGENPNKSNEKILPSFEVSNVKYQNNIFLDGSQSFIKALNNMDKSLQNAKTDDMCNSYDPEKPNFKLDGRRISEIECLNYIWNMKMEEETQDINDRCPLSGIVGGHQSKPGEHPHMGAIGWKGEIKGKWEFKCGGSLISDRFVLTAAHCEFDENRKHPKIVRFGVVDIASETLISNGEGVDMKILDFTRHPDYIPGYKNYDIALIKLVHRVQFTQTIQPACLLKQRPIEEAVITGWGALSDENDSVISDILQVAEVNVLPIKECRNSWRPKRDKREWKGYFVDQVCAKGNTTDICGGDSGGPLQTKLITNTNQSIHNIVGITAFNYECGNQKFPSVYTRVQFHINWIENVVWGANHEHISRLDDRIRKEIPSASNQNDKEDIKKPGEVTENSRDSVKVKQVQRFENGRLFWFDTKKGNGWAYIAESEIASYPNNSFDLNKFLIQDKS